MRKQVRTQVERQAARQAARENQKPATKEETIKFIKWLENRSERIELENEQIKEGLKKLEEEIR